MCEGGEKNLYRTVALADMVQLANHKLPKKKWYVVSFLFVINGIGSYLMGICGVSFLSIIYF